MVNVCGERDTRNNSCLWIFGANAWVTVTYTESTVLKKTQIFPKRKFILDILGFNGCEIDVESGDTQFG